MVFPIFTLILNIPFFDNSGGFGGQVGFWLYLSLIFTLRLRTLIFDNSGGFGGLFGVGVSLA